MLPDKYEGEAQREGNKEISVDEHEQNNVAVLQEDRGLKKQVKDLQSALHLANTKNKSGTTEAKKAESKCSQLMTEVTQVKNEAS